MTKTRGKYVFDSRRFCGIAGGAMKPFSFSLLLALTLTGCERSQPPAATPPAQVAPPATTQVPAVPPVAPAEEPWIAGNELGDWQPLETASQAKVSMKDGVLTMGNGDGVSGVHYAGKRPLPVVDYEISWEGMKLDGVDFFASATFPVRDLKTCVTFVNGGWGGGVTGISCIDDMAANENNTTAMVSYKLNQWYKFRVQITAELLAAYVDDKEVCKISIKDKKVGMRYGDIESCAPLGFATYQTKGAVRNLKFRKLQPGELKSDLDTF